MVAVGLGAHVDASACQLTANALEQLDMSTVIALLEQS